MVCQFPKRAGRPRHLHPCSATYRTAFSASRLLNPGNTWEAFTKSRSSFSTRLPSGGSIIGNRQVNAFTFAPGDEIRALSENLVDPLILLGFRDTGTQAARSVECG